MAKTRSLRNRRTRNGQRKERFVDSCATTEGCASPRRGARARRLVSGRQRRESLSREFIRCCAGRIAVDDDLHAAGRLREGEEIVLLDDRLEDDDVGLAESMRPALREPAKYRTPTSAKSM